MPKLCDSCLEAPALRRYKDTENGAEHQWCDDCSRQIVGPKVTYATYGRSFDLIGPADNPEARQDWAKGLIHLALNTLIEAHTLPEVVDLLAGVLDLPDLVWEVAVECADLQTDSGQVVLAKTA